MSIIAKNKKVVIQGIMRNGALSQVKLMKSYGTKILAAVVPGKEGKKIEGIPVYDKVEKTIAELEINTSIVFSEPENVKRDVLEAIVAGIRLIIINTPDVPVQDMVVLNYYAEQTETRLLGPGSSGIIVVGDMKLGVMPEGIFQKGNIGVVGKSETLSYEVIYNLTKQGIGQSSFIDLGAGSVNGASYIDLLPLFEADEDTKLVVMVGGVSGLDEERSAAYISKMNKPVLAYIFGQTLQQSTLHDKAGAMISGYMSTYESKCQALLKAGAHIVTSLEAIPDFIKAYQTSGSDKSSKLL